MALINYLDKLKKGSLWSLIARIFGSGTGFIVTILLARVLTLEMLGVFYLIQAIIRFSGLFVKVGLDFSIQKINGIYSGNKDWSSVRLCTKSMFSILSVSSLFIIILLASIWDWLASDILKSPLLLSLMFLVLISIPLRSMEEIGSAFFRSVQEPKIGVFLFDIPRQTLFMVCLFSIFFFYESSSIALVVGAYVVSSSVAVLIVFTLLFFWFRKKKIISNTEVNTDLGVKSLVFLSAPMMIQGSAAIIMSTADIWILSIYSTQDDIGIYGTVVRLTTLIVLILGVVNMVLPSMLASIYKSKDMQAIEKLLRMSATWGGLIAIPLLLVFVIAGEDILGLVFGDNFRSGYVVLSVLAISHAFNALSGSPGILLQMTGHHKVLMKITLFWAVFNLGLNILLVNIWGMLGVAVATAISIVCQNLTMMILAMRLHGIKTWMYNPMMLFK